MGVHETLLHDDAEGGGGGFRVSRGGGGRWKDGGQGLNNQICGSEESTSRDARGDGGERLVMGRRKGWMLRTGGYRGEVSVVLFRRNGNLNTTVGYALCKHSPVEQQRAKAKLKKRLFTFVTNLCVCIHTLFVCGCMPASAHAV